MNDILDMDATRQVDLIRRGDLSAEDLMRACLARIEAVNGVANAIVALRDRDDLLAEARARDNAPDKKGALHGLPVAIKDLANVEGMITSHGSPIFTGLRARADDLHVARKRAAGVIFIGKTNTPEFGLGSHTFNPVHGATCNAYDPRLSSGGSSGGAAVALALQMLGIADGSDMMGSLRNPAGWNNIYGFRPSWGRVPSEPEGDTFLHQLATNGPMARCPSDLALLLNVMSGPDPRQPHGLAPECFTASQADLRGRRIAWLADWGGALPMEEGILDLCQAALKVFEDLGCHIEPISAPFSRDALWQSWTILRSWSVASALKPLMDNPHSRAQLKDSAIWEAERGLALSAGEIHAASVIRSDWFRAAAGLFDRFDALAAPTAQVWPFAIDQPYPTQIAGQAMDSYHRWMEVTISASLIGLPALAVPAGFGARGLPMGLQMIGRHGDDQSLLTLAETYHHATLWPARNRNKRLT